MHLLNQINHSSKSCQWYLRLITAQPYQQQLTTLFSKRVNACCYQQLLISITLVSKSSNWKIQHVNKLCLNSDKWISQANKQFVLNHTNRHITIYKYLN